MNQLKKLKELETELSSFKRRYADLALEYNALKYLIEKSFKSCYKARDCWVSGRSVWQLILVYLCITTDLSAKLRIQLVVGIWSKWQKSILLMASEKYTIYCVLKGIDGTINAYTECM